jgi:hypothetical protein
MELILVIILLILLFGGGFGYYRGSLGAYHQGVIAVDRTIGHSGRLIDRARALPGGNGPVQRMVSYDDKLRLEVSR